MNRWLTLLALPIVLFAFVACGGNDDDDAEPTNGAESPTGDGPDERLSDTEYLDVLCTGLEDFASAVETASEADMLADVIQNFIASLEPVVPPEDLETFHSEFIGYLEESVDDPTRPLAVEPPLPPDDVRRRLVDLEPSVDSCRNPTFFHE